MTSQSYMKNTSRRYMIRFETSTLNARLTDGYNSKDML